MPEPVKASGAQSVSNQPSQSESIGLRVDDDDFGAVRVCNAPIGGVDHGVDGEGKPVRRDASDDPTVAELVLEPSLRAVGDVDEAEGQDGRHYGPPIGWKMVTAYGEWEMTPLGLGHKPLPFDPNRTTHDEPSDDFTPDGVPISDAGRKLLGNL